MRYFTARNSPITVRPTLSLFPARSRRKSNTDCAEAVSRAALSAVIPSSCKIALKGCRGGTILSLNINLLLCVPRFLARQAGLLAHLLFRRHPRAIRRANAPAAQRQQRDPTHHSECIFHRPQTNYFEAAE